MVLMLMTMTMTPIMGSSINDDGVDGDNNHDDDLNEKDDDDRKIYHQCSLGGWGISATELRSWVAPDEKSQRPFSSSAAVAELQCARIKSLRLFSWCTSL